MVTPLLALLVKEVGQPVAQRIWGVISGSERTGQLSKATESVQKGTTALVALQKAFGKDYFDLVNNAMNFGSGYFTFEAGTSDYIPINIDGENHIQLLRMELNTNLERIIRSSVVSEDKAETLNYFKGVFKVWKSRFISILGVTKQEQDVFEYIDELLDFNKINRLPIHSVIYRASNKMSITMGLLVFFQAFLLISGFGVGIWANLVILTIGIPVIQIGVLIILGVLLFAFGFKSCKEKHVMSLCVSMAYSILDKKDNTPMFSKFKENGSSALKTKSDTSTDNKVVNNGLSPENSLSSNELTPTLTPSFSVGEKGPAGGIVFHVLENGLHGMEAAPIDSSSAIWGFYGKSLPADTHNEVGAGKANTAAIIACSGESMNAGKVAGNYVLNNFNDWYLPSRDELKLLYGKKSFVGGFISNIYWSSSEIGIAEAWSLDFIDGDQDYGQKDEVHGVRVIRSF